MSINQDATAMLNKIIAEELGYGKGRRKGTATYYYVGTIGNKSVCYTRAKTYYNGRFGFWSWIQTRYKRITKRTRFALSGSKAKAQARANRLFKQITKQ